MFYRPLRFLGGPLIRTIWVKKTTGSENIPASGPLILAANHTSYFDFLVLSAVFPRRIYWLAAEKFFRSPAWALLAYGTGQIKVDRLNQDKKATYVKALDLLKQGQVIGIFPEGTRSWSGQLLRAFPGVARLSLLADTPVLPAGLTGTYQILPRQKILPRFKKCSVSFGQLFQPAAHYPDYRPDQEDENRLQSLADDIMGQIGQLAGLPYGARDGAAAFFDVDNTVIDGLSLQILLKYLKQKRVIKATDYWRNLGGFILYKFGLLQNPSRLRASALGRLLQARSADQLGRLFKDCFEEKIKPRVWPGARRLIKGHQENQQPVYFVSASLIQLVEPLARYLGVNGWQASDPEIIAGRFTGSLRTRPPWSEEKSRIIKDLAQRHRLDLSQSYFYSDHISDLPALEAVGHPVLINPDRRLRRLGQKRDWPIIDKIALRRQ